MKKLLLAAALATLGASAAIADPVLGTWKTQSDDGNYAYISMAACGAKICGKIAKTFNSDGEFKSENAGKPLVWDMVAQGDGDYKNGKIWQPSKDRVYNSKMSLNGNTLKVSGCVGPICKKQTWTRVK